MFDMFAFIDKLIVSSFIKYLSLKIKIEPNKCWNWTGYKDATGYGRVSIGAHKLFYLLLKGNYDNDLELHHECHNTSCVNPDHLKPITHEEHAKLTPNPSTLNSQKKYCGRGHAFTKDNTYIYRRTRNCKMCIVRRNYIQHFIIEKYS